MSGSRHRSRLLAVLVTVILVQSLGLWWLIDSRVATPATSFAQAPDVAPNCPITAGAASNWGTPNRTDDFNDPSSLRSWYVYDGPGHEGNGRRTPDAISISTGLMTITGDAQGN